MTWYEVVNYSCKIVPIEIVRFNDKSVWISETRKWPSEKTVEKRQSIESDWSNKFPTYAEAFDYAKKRIEGRLHNARGSVIDLEQMLAALILKEPSAEKAS